MSLAELVGIPYAVAGDCYGLVRLALRDLAGVELPERQCGPTAQAREAIIGAGLPGWERVQRPARFDIVVLRDKGKPTHVGLCLGAGRFLHVCEGGRSRIDRFGPHWIAEGFYRHV